MATKQILRKISGGENLMIESLDGRSTIADAEKIFKSSIDGNFQHWELNEAGKATKQLLVDVREMVQDATFIQIFTSINVDLDKVAMTQHQIIRFCEKHPTWLCQNGYATFFLTKENNEYFVVSVCVFSAALAVCVNRVGFDHVWVGKSRSRVVSPQLIPLEP
jgi:hypothetical protein